MDFKDFIKDKKVFISENFMTDIEGIELLLAKQNEFEILKYPCMKKILILNIFDMQINKKGKYYYDYELKRDCDIASDFVLYSKEPNIKFSFICGFDEYDINDLKEIIFAACMYSSIKLRITFNDEIVKDENKEIILTYNKYLCNRNISYYLMKNKMITPTIIYNEGICLKK